MWIISCILLSSYRSSYHLRYWRVIDVIYPDVLLSLYLINWSIIWVQFWSPTGVVISPYYYFSTSSNFHNDISKSNQIQYSNLSPISDHFNHFISAMVISY